MMLWNSRNDQGAFLTNSLLKGHQRSLEAKNSLFCQELLIEKNRTLGMASLCFLVKMHRLICNMTYFGHYVTLTCGKILTLTNFDLFDLDLSRSNHM